MKKASSSPVVLSVDMSGIDDLYIANTKTQLIRRLSRLPLKALYKCRARVAFAPYLYFRTVTEMARL